MTASDTQAAGGSTNRSTSLTRGDAVKRAQIIAEVADYQIVIDLTDGAGHASTDTFRSTTTVKFIATAGEQTFIDIVPGLAGALHSATLNGTPIDIGGYDENQGITLSGLANDNTVVIEAQCTYSHDGEGLYRFEDPSEQEVYLYTQLETAAAKRVFACFDQPDLKASFGLTVIAPNSWHVVSNTTAQIEDAANAKVHKFVFSARISTYLVALIAGPYDSWEDRYIDERATIPLRIFCRQSLSGFMDAVQLFDLTKRGFAFYHRTFGVTYPFGKYDQVFCPAYNAGAMENVAAVTFTEDFVFRGKVTRYQYARRAETLVHEMAHMWFGNLVTMRWWDDLWLNESFATWAANLCLAEATEFREAWTTFANVEKPKAYRQDQFPSAHPVAGDVANLELVLANFDPITYIKGASTLKQLVAYIGGDHFLAGLRDYFTTHAFGNATFDDLLTALAHQAFDGDRDLHGWAQQWLKTTGLNTLRADFDVDAATFTRFAVTQSRAEPGNSEPRVHRLRIGVYDADSGKLIQVHQTPAEIRGNSTEIAALRGVACGQLVLVDDEDDTYCLLGLDSGSLATALTRIADIEEPLPRARVWSAIWEMTRAGRLAARDFVTLVIANLHSETQIAVVENLITQAQIALTSYTEPRWATTDGWAQLADQLLKLARDSQPGSDEQLAFINGLGADRVKERQRSSVLAHRHTRVLLALLDTEPADLGLGGLRVDTDMRWRIVIALAAAGVLDDAAIDAEYQRHDRSPAGHLNAEQAKAARPLDSGKREAWRRLLVATDISNTDARAVVAGFAAPGQAALLAPYSPRYFDSIVELWNNRPQAVGITLATGLYPVWDISQDCIDAADELLERKPPPSLGRLIREGQDEVRRALAARTIDSGRGH
jgi:aminopeptidase N